MELWTAFLLGLVGSAHCAGMCGPLALALPVTGGARAKFLAGRALYNLGRITTYSLMGVLFGLLGKTFAVAGLQRGVSLGAGAVILIGLVASPNLGLTNAATGLIGWVKLQLAQPFRRRSLGSLFAIGALNGFLPCGLVYAACVAAVATGGVWSGAQYMAVFGLGTTPMLLAISILGQRLQLQLRFKLQRLIPVSLALVGGLLLLRGLSLGIPYLSPDLSAGHLACCHE